MLEATRRITADPALAATRVIVLTTFERDEYVFAALHAGASGFLLKDTPPRLLEAITTVVDGGALLAPSVTRVIAEFTARSSRRVPHPQLGQLTERERRSSRWSRRGSPTTRSPSGWSLAPPPPGRTSRTR